MVVEWRGKKAKTFQFKEKMPVKVKHGGITCQERLLEREKKALAD